MTTVVGRFSDPQDPHQPASGTVWFSVVTTAVDTTPDRRFVTRAPVRCDLDDTGGFSVDLLPSDHPDWLVEGLMPYRVLVAVSGHYGEYSTIIPDTEVIDLSELVVLDAPPDVVTVPGGPVGPPPVLVDGTTVTLAPGSQATSDVVPVGAAGEYRVDFGIPRGRDGQDGDDGEVGPPPTLVDGVTATLPPGSAATSDVVPTGVLGEYRIDLGIPQGGQGDEGDVGPPPLLFGGSTATLAPGSSATSAVVPTGTPGEYRLDFGIPRGQPGLAGADSVVPGPPGHGITIYEQAAEPLAAVGGDVWFVTD